MSNLAKMTFGHFSTGCAHGPLTSIGKEFLEISV